MTIRQDSDGKNLILTLRWVGDIFKVLINHSLWAFYYLIQLNWNKATFLWRNLVFQLVHLEYVLCVYTCSPNQRQNEVQSCKHKQQNIIYFLLRAWLFIYRFLTSVLLKVLLSLMWKGSLCCSLSFFNDILKSIRNRNMIKNLHVEGEGRQVLIDLLDVFTYWHFLLILFLYYLHVDPLSNVGTKDDVVSIYLI